MYAVRQHFQAVNGFFHFHIEVLPVTCVVLEAEPAQQLVQHHPVAAHKTLKVKGNTEACRSVVALLHGKMPMDAHGDIWHIGEADSGGRAGAPTSNG